MAPSAPPVSTTASNSGGSPSSHIPTAQDVTTAGGVWAPTSAKRDKLAELKGALNESLKAVAEDEKPLFGPSLNDLATPIQKLDLWLVDGMQAIAQVVDEGGGGGDDTALSSWPEVQKWMTDMYKEKDDLLTQHQWEDYLRRFQREIERHLALQTTQTPDMLQYVRDYVNVGPHVEQLDTAPPDSVTQSTPLHYNVAVERYRLLLAQAAAQVLLESFPTLVKVSSHDIDRAAVEGTVAEEKAAGLSLPKLEAVLQSYLQGSAADRVDAWWALMDRDDDGLLLEEEMNTVCEMSIRPVAKALQNLLKEALQAHPVRSPPTDDGSLPVPKGWRQRRQESKAQRQLQKMFDKSIQTHFQDQVEMAHRLRCIYTWANKVHQDNAIASVLVDEIAWTGRKRYVELPPKIRLEEFRQVQREHFPHLDRVATEYCQSWREDLWIVQGNGRQRKELYRDCTLFMAVVCGIDYAIISL